MNSVAFCPAGTACALVWRAVAFRHTEKATEIPKPIPGQKTCTAAAHSQQVALEECLLDCTLLPDGSFQNITAITHSWASGLVYTVQQTAVGVLVPSVLVHETSGSAYLIVLSLGRCVWGWQLRVHSAEKILLVMVHPIRALVPIVLTSPHLGPAIPSQVQVQEPHSFFRLGNSVNPTHFPTNDTKNSSDKPNKSFIALIRWRRYGGDQYMDLPVRVACDTLGGQVLRMSALGRDTPRFLISGAIRRIFCP